MAIITYRSDPRFTLCDSAFLVTGSPDHDDFNREMIRNNRTGYWSLKKGRVSPGDLIFIILPSKNNRSGYPRNLYAGVIQNLERGEDHRNLFIVREFFELPPIEDGVKTFLGGKVPPQGNTVLEVWSTPEKSKKAVAKFIVTDEDDESAFPEGNAKFKAHRARERDPEIIRKAKQKRLNESGMLSCEVCNANFEKIYGDRGRGFIEAHHRIHVSKLDGKTKTKISDLSMVCSNCHRMLHRGPLLTVEELRDFLLGQKT